MSVGERVLRSWYEYMASISQPDVGDWGRHGTYLLIVAFFAWGICLGLYRGNDCEIYRLPEPLLKTLLTVSLHPLSTVPGPRLAGERT